MIILDEEKNMGIEWKLFFFDFYNLISENG